MKNAVKYLISIIIAGPAYCVDFNVRNLTIDDAVLRGVSISPELEKARLALESVKLDEPLLLSELDTRLEAGYAKSEDESPRVAPSFEGTRSEIEDFGVSLVQNTLIGTEARLSWENQRVVNSAPFRILNPSVESALTLSVRQPLLRYFWGRPDIARRRRFRSIVLAAEANGDYLKNHVIAQISRSYLEATFSKERVRIAEAAVTEARRLYASYREKKTYGLIEDSDLIQAEALLEAFEADVALASSDFQKSIFALKEWLRFSLDEEEKTFDVSFPQSSWLWVSVKTLDEALQLAREKRGDLRKARLIKDAAEWRFRMEKLDTLPDLSFVGSYGGAGLSDDYSGAWDDLGGFDHIVKSAGLNFTVPFGSKKEKLLRKTKKLELESAQQDSLRMEDLTAREVKDAWESWQLQMARLKARERLVKLQTAKIKAETVNFQRGRSSTDILVRFQQDVHEADLNLARTRTDELLARIELMRSMGVLLDLLAGGRNP